MAYLLVYVKDINEYHIASNIFNDQIEIGDEISLKFFRSGQMRQYTSMILYKGLKEACESKAKERNSSKNISPMYSVCEKIGKID